MGGLSVDEVSHLRKRERSLLLGICLDDFSLLHDTIRILKEKKIHHVILGGGDRWDSGMDALALQEGIPQPIFSLKMPPVVPTSKDPGITVDRLIAAAFGKFEPKELMIGIDPGKRPGIAFIADGLLISARRTTGPEDVLSILRKGVKAFRPSKVQVRIGDGDPERRDPLIELVKASGYSLEMVDESQTTKTKRYRDENAAVLIAYTIGESI